LAPYLSQCPFEQAAVILELLVGLSPQQAINLELSVVTRVFLFWCVSSSLFSQFL
jgi:hypothetical protein